MFRFDDGFHPLDSELFNDDLCSVANQFVSDSLSIPMIELGLSDVMSLSDDNDQAIDTPQSQPAPNLPRIFNHELSSSREPSRDHYYINGFFAGIDDAFMKKTQNLTNKDMAHGYHDSFSLIMQMMIDANNETLAQTKCLLEEEELKQKKIINDQMMTITHEKNPPNPFGLSLSETSFFSHSHALICNAPCSDQLSNSHPEKRKRTYRGDFSSPSKNPRIMRGKSSV